MSLAQRAALLIVRAYQLLLGPIAGGGCRFEPSCSVYALEAVEAHGAFRGGWLALCRVARCHPFSKPGVDPVPAARPRR
jgi:putative membrane protein insertion efficiency factor